MYIQNITVAEHDGHSDSFQVEFSNVFTHYPNDAVRVEDQKFKDWDHYKFTLWQSQLNFAVFCASSACGVSVEHLNAMEPMIRTVYRFHVYYQIRRILTHSLREVKPLSVLLMTTPDPTQSAPNPEVKIQISGGNNPPSTK